MLKYGWSRRDRREQERREPVYCVLTESEVTAELLEMRHVDEKGRIGAVALDMEGQPIEIPVESTHDDMQSFFPGPGRFAVIARNARGRIEGRNDYTVWQDGGQPLPRNQIEVYRDERDAERKARRAAEAEMETVQKRNDELHERSSRRSSGSPQWPTRRRAGATSSSKRSPKSTSGGSTPRRRSQGYASWPIERAGWRASPGCRNCWPVCSIMGTQLREGYGGPTGL